MGQGVPGHHSPAVTGMSTGGVEALKPSMAQLYNRGQVACLHSHMHAFINLFIHPSIHPSNLSTNGYRELILGQTPCYVLGISI